MDGGYAVDFDEYANIALFWIVFYIKNDDKIYFGGFGELIPNRLKSLLLKETLMQIFSEYNHLAH